jgi:DNA-binding CsgD family transcriptional regulator
MVVIDYERGRELMERSLTIARGANLPFAIAGTLANLSQMLVELYQLADAKRYLAEGIAYTAEHDDDYHLQGMLTLRAFVHLYQGHWTEANEILLKVLQTLNVTLNVDTTIHTYALWALGRLRVRQGDSASLVMLHEALALSIQVDAIPRLGPTRAARAEAAWLTSNNDLAIEEARAVYDIAVSKEHPWIAGELAFGAGAGDDFAPPVWMPRPFALQIAGDWLGAAVEWEQRGCPYEQALALMDGDEAAQLAALEIFERLGARPIIEKLKQKMRSEGMRGIPRGARPTTRENLFGLTAREMEVLASLVEGLNNNAIAKKLSLSTRTVEHHIASICKRCRSNHVMRRLCWL